MAGHARPADRLRVLDLTTGIAGGYCGKLLADAGADVAKVEPPGGDPLRRSGSGALFAFLTDPKHLSSTRHAADVVLTNHPHASTDGAVVTVTITPYGCDGPYAARPATEFTLQAACGSTGQRGLPAWTPLAAGGSLGEWLTGTYAAVAAVAAHRRALAVGAAQHVDVAMLDCMTLGMNTFQTVFEEFGWPAPPGPARVVEVPSVEPTADGFVTFTTNSAQQFGDFAVMVGHPEWTEDQTLLRANTRFARRDEILAAVHAFTRTRSTAQVLDAAGGLRIPAAPVLDGATVPGWGHFAERGVFRRGAGGYLGPRVPYRVAPPATLAPVPAGGALPLSGVRVIEMTAWWAGPSAAHLLACLGADVVKVESVGRPDLMRFSSPKPPTTAGWFEWSPVFHGANNTKRGITLDLTTDDGVRLAEHLLAAADVMVENNTPRVLDQFGLGWDRVHALNPRLIMVRMPGFGLDGPWRDRPGFAQTMESVSGMVWTTGLPDGPPVLPRGACDPLAGCHGAFATLVALAGREQDGQGRLVEVPMVESALNAAAEQVLEFDATGVRLERLGNRSREMAPQGVYPCAGAESWVAISVPDDDAWVALRTCMGDPPMLTDERLDHVAGRLEAHDLIDAQIVAWCADLAVDHVAGCLAAAAVPAEPVVAGRSVSGHPQLRHRHFFEIEDHPVTGRHELPSLPFRVTGIDHWITRPAPTLGQHTAEVLGEAGVGEDELARLARGGIIGTELR